MSKRFIPATKERVLYDCDRCKAEDIIVDATFAKKHRAMDGAYAAETTYHFCEQCGTEIHDALFTAELEINI